MSKRMTRSAIHPGEILADELDELTITPTELARQLSVPANRITQIIQGKRAITGDTALRLGHWFGTSAQFWLNLQSAYDIRIAQSLAGDDIDHVRGGNRDGLGIGSARREQAERERPGENGQGSGPLCRLVAATLNVCHSAAILATSRMFAARAS